MRAKKEYGSGESAELTEGRKLRQAAQALLSLPLPEEREDRAELKERGIGSATEADALMLVVLKKALKGEMDAIKFLRDIAGESAGAKAEAKKAGEPDFEKLDLSALSERELMGLMGDG